MCLPSPYNFNQPVALTYIVIVAMYSIRCIYPMGIRLIHSNFLLRPGHSFLTIW